MGQPLRSITANLRLAKAPAFGPTSTRIELPPQPTFPPVRRKPKS